MNSEHKNSSEGHPLVSLSIVGTGDLLLTSESFRGFAVIGGGFLAIFFAWWLLTFTPYNIVVERDASQAARFVPLTLGFPCH